MAWAKRLGGIMKAKWIIESPAENDQVPVTRRLTIKGLIWITHERETDGQSHISRIAKYLIAVGFVIALGSSAGCGHRTTTLADESNASLSGEGFRMRPLTDRTFERTPIRLERGRYLVEGVLHCFYCHAQRDWDARGAPAIADRKGGGCILIDEPGHRRVAPNISPDMETGAGTWTDDMFARAIREGIGHDGRALFGMPWRTFRNLPDEDLASVISYIRSIPPVSNALPKRILNEEEEKRLDPQPLTEPVPQPDLSTPVKRGQYLVSVADCRFCHTPRQNNRPIPGLEFSGGFALKSRLGEVASANITPDPSGISYYDEALFLEVIRTGKVKARELNATMPWGFFRNIADEDLKSIFAYLQTLKPVSHRVDNTEPPTGCKLCGQRHGFGDRNEQRAEDNP